MQERFKQLLEEKNLTATRFAAMIKVNASAMSHILNGRSKPGFDVLDKIAQAFPEVNLNWLISGKGPIYNNISSPQPMNQVQSPSLFQETNKEETGVKQVSPTSESTVVPTIENSSIAGKKIKRIILFFDDGSFEDYEK